MSDATPMLEATDLGRRYGDRWALAGVNVRLSAGRSLLVAGHNGVGKTTLLRLLAGLLRPDAGAVVRRGAVGMVGHRGGHWVDLGARETLQLDARLLGRRLERGAALALLDRFGLAGRGDDAVWSLSAGLKKRLALARLALQDPPIVLLDEPYGELDHDGSDCVDALVRDTLARGRCLVMSTHAFERAAGLLHHGLVLEAGRMRWVGAAAEVPAQLARAGERAA